MNYTFKGTGVAMVTAFKADGEIDYNSMEKLIEHLITNKVDYILIMGTTAESACLSKKEKSEILKFAKEKISGRVPIMYGLGGNNTDEVLKTISDTDFTGIDGILSVSPYYNKPNQTGLYNHFMKIADASPVQVVLYNVPGRTSVSISHDTILKLANHKNITGIKEASGSIDIMMNLIKDAPKDFYILSGDDALALPLIALGGHGVISVLANAYPKEWSEMINNALNGNLTQAKETHYKFLDTIGLMFNEGNPCGVKCYLNEMEILENNLRMPLVKASLELTELIKQDMAKK